jgi:hypothetical protein
MPKQAPSTETKTYYIEREGGNDQRVTVPAHWKVTFGPLNPGAKNAAYDQGKPALRFWETKDLQRMVVTNVKSFRDESIVIEEKRTSVKQQVLRKQTPAGEKEVIVEARVEEWVNPDKPVEAGPEFFRLEHSNDTI